LPGPGYRRQVARQVRSARLVARRSLEDISASCVHRENGCVLTAPGHLDRGGSIEWLCRKGRTCDAGLRSSSRDFPFCIRQRRGGTRRQMTRLTNRDHALAAWRDQVDLRVLTPRDAAAPSGWHANRLGGRAHNLRAQPNGVWTLPGWRDGACRARPGGARGTSGNHERQRDAQPC
jgi:hypothetical protein